ncbi:hypothetical protein Tco_0540366 [Tanacetum coccineum]
MRCLSESGDKHEFVDQRGAGVVLSLCGHTLDGSRTHSFTSDSGVCDVGIACEQCGSEEQLEDNSVHERAGVCMYRRSVGVIEYIIESIRDAYTYLCITFDDGSIELLGLCSLEYSEWGGISDSGF